MKGSTRIAAIYGLMGLAGVLAVAPAAFHQFTRPHCSGPGKARNFCIANLKQIEGAKNTWQLEHYKTTNDIPTDSDIFGTNLYVTIKPTCMAGGVYTLGRAGDPPTCSVSGHRLPD